mmetsp:Transcript_21274/g.31541  ORF Transcript_21274/g.31541 Transcript_21274/m.31541 type:complete len:181 (-) Transcript_21274:1228-1770(-)
MHSKEMSSSPLEQSTCQNVVSEALVELDKQRPEMFDLKPASPSSPGETEKKQRGRSVRVQKKILKYNKHDDKIFTAKKGRLSKSKITSRRKKSISFDESVEVVPIPKRDEYSSRVKQRLWANANEIHQNAARNTIEFLSEGWNWRNVMEDEGMHLCVATGERIHPIHYENLGIKPGDFVP